MKGLHWRSLDVECGKRERLPSTITTYFEVKSEKHVWLMWNQLNKQIKRSGKVNRRHDYFTVSNWSFLANLENEEDLSLGKNAFTYTVE